MDRLDRIFAFLGKVQNIKSLIREIGKTPYILSNLSKKEELWNFS